MHFLHLENATVFHCEQEYARFWSRGCFPFDKTLTNYQQLLPGSQVTRLNEYSKYSPFLDFNVLLSYTNLYERPTTKKFLFFFNS